MQIIYATSNKAKRDEVQKVIKYHNYDVEIETLSDIGFTDEIDENGETFEDNSLIKAKAVREYCKKNNIHKVVVADDAGLVVDALGGRPGVHSARYAGDHAPQKVVLAKLLNEMKDVEDDKRTAMFVCVLTAITDDDEVIVSKGTTEGSIAKECGTMGGLTYCPVFIPKGKDKVMNDLTLEEIDETHRGKAWKAILEKMKDK